MILDSYSRLSSAFMRDTRGENYEVVVTKGFSKKKKKLMFKSCSHPSTSTDNEKLTEDFLQASPVHILESHDRLHSHYHLFSSNMIVMVMLHFNRSSHVEL